MGINIVIQFISILASALTLAIFVQVIFSWFMPQSGAPFMRVLQDITEPVLAPIRRVLPPFGGLDFSPIVAMILIQVISSLLINVLSSSA